MPGDPPPPYSGKQDAAGLGERERGKRGGKRDEEKEREDQGEKKDVLE